MKIFKRANRRLQFLLLGTLVGLMGPLPVQAEPDYGFTGVASCGGKVDKKNRKLKLSLGLGNQGDVRKPGVKLAVTASQNGQEYPLRIRKISVKPGKTATINFAWRTKGAGDVGFKAALLAADSATQMDTLSCDVLAQDDGQTPNVDLSGKLWHNNYALDYRDGSQIASLNGAAPQQVTGKLPAYPWLDGNQYLTTDSSDLDYTDARVYSLQTGEQLYQYTFSEYLRGERPSPVSQSVILATWSEDSISTPYALFFDFATEQILDVFEYAGSVIDWLPDGRYLRVSTDGTIRTGIVGGAETATGSLSMPEGRHIGDVSVSPDGKQMLLALAVLAIDDSIDESDLWLANIDGSALKRFTKTKMSNYGVWSPDSGRIAFDIDTGLVCSGYYCAGSCELWYGKTSAADLDGLSETADQRYFRVKDRSGKTRRLGCELQAWTR
ncbi:hypothetical protein [Methylomonas sp. HYX-M1]|uniref:hypothetical protein n=1 Tax=Methylomonas sp. HYX-M1 TaxID=3139307 RepID=UPI00345C54BA